MKRKVVGLDFDDVLVSFNEAFLLFHNKHYETSYKKHDIISYDLEILLGCSKEEEKRRIISFVDSVDHNSILPIYGAVEAVKELSKDFDLVIVTARPPETEMVTRELLKHFTDTQKKIDNIFKKIHFVGTRTGPGTTITKAEVCKKEAVDIFVEDNLKNSINIALSGMPVLLLDQPWNKEEVLPPNVTRVHSWIEIEREIRSKLLV